MLNTPRSRRGMVTSPHHLASEAGLRVLREGGNAIEATLAMAASLPVVYPHMNSLGGDGFWLISRTASRPLQSTAAARRRRRRRSNSTRARACPRFRRAVPSPANTVAGTLSGWAEVLAINTEMGGKFPLSRLVEDAVWSAENGFAVTATQQELTETKFAELKDSPGFVDTFLLGGQLPKEGQLMKLPALGKTLKRLGKDGPMDFYTGALAKEIAADLARCGSPVTLEDLAAHKAQRREALSVAIKGATLYNFPPPTQGLASLMILAIFDRLGVQEAETFEYLHGIVEAPSRRFWYATASSAIQPT